MATGDVPFKQMVEAAPAFVAMVADGRIQYLNQTAANLLGLDSKQDGIGRCLLDFVHVDDRASLDELLSLRMSGVYVPIRLDRADGIVSNLNVSLAEPSGGAEAPLVLVGADSTDLQRATAALRSREQRLQRLLEAAVDPIVTIDSAGEAVQFNQAAVEAFEFAAGEVIGRSLEILLPESGFIEGILNDARNPQAVGEDRETEGRAKSGRTFPCAVAWSRYQSGDGMYATLIIRDITGRKSVEEQLRFLALIDPSTGLPNRAHLVEKLESMLDSEDGEVALVGVDVDRLRAVNDAFGHDFGDRLIKKISHRLLSTVGESDFLARVGGDDFLVIVPIRTAPAALMELASRMQRAFHEPFLLDGFELYVTVSIGVAIGPEHGNDVASLMRNAESATYHAKRMGRDNHQLFSREIADRQEERVRLESELRKAIENQDFQLFYQPKVLTETGEVVGMEALLRWTHKALGPISPSKFIPVAEASGLISELGQWLIERACRDTACLVSQGHTDLHCAINISPLQFRDSGLAERITGAMADAGLSPRLLEIEITESGLMDDVDLVIGALRTLKNAGLSIAVDDFGTGYSSLAYLKRFPLDTLKIDQSFIRGVPNDRDDVSIASAIIGMGQSLDLDLVAEGVENREQVDFLLQRQCRVAQGYLFGRPMSADDFGRFLEKAATPRRALVSGSND